MTAEADEAIKLQRLLLEGMLEIVARGRKRDEAFLMKYPQ